MFRIRNSTDAIAWAWLAGILAVVGAAGWLAWKLGAFIWRIVT